MGLDFAIDAAPPPCRKSICAATKLGVLLQGLKNAGFNPSPVKTEHMRRSVLEYWKDIKSIGSAYASYSPCDKTSIGYSSYAPATHTSSCTLEKCSGDFGIKNAMKMNLQRYAHKEIWDHWVAVCPQELSYSLLTHA